MKKKKDIKVNSLSEQEILAFEHEKLDNKLLKRYKNSEKRIKMKFISLRILLILVFATCVYYFCNWYNDNKKNSELFNSLSEYITTEPQSDKNQDTTKIDFEGLKAINNQVYAWIKVPGTNINYPAVHYTNNDYYLNHSFDNSANSAGCIFVDYSNKCNGKDRNLILYGHNMRNGNMFGTLKNTLKEEWYSNKDNHIIELYTENGLEQYEVFSCYEIKAETYYLTKVFASNDKFENFVETLKNRSVYNFNVDISGTDSILTLSTCSNNNAYRTVLHAKKIVKEVPQEEVTPVVQKEVQTTTKKTPSTTNKTKSKTKKR